jgi:hypothetical protein
MELETTTEEMEMTRYEFLVESDGERRIFPVESAGTIAEAKAQVPSHLQIVKLACMVDLEPQVFLAW